MSKTNKKFKINYKIQKIIIINNKKNKNIKFKKKLFLQNEISYLSWHFRNFQKITLF